MARHNRTLARALILYLALLPLLGAAAEVQAAPQVAKSPRPFAPPPGPTGPLPPQPDEIVFEAVAEPLTLRAFNGFNSDATPGSFNHQGHGHPGGVAKIDSPWGEQLDIRYWFSPHGVTFEYDDDLRVSYRFNEDGTLAEIRAKTPEREASTAVGKRAELAYLGLRDPESFDLSAYVLIDESLRARHSDAFLSGLASFDAPAQASCVTQGIQCVACIVGWGISVAAITTACLVGGVPTMGTACLAAILAHEVASFSCAASCVGWIMACFSNVPGDGGGPIDPGCEF